MATADYLEIEAVGKIGTANHTFTVTNPAACCVYSERDNEWKVYPWLEGRFDGFECGVLLEAEGQWFAYECDGMYAPNDRRLVRPLKDDRPPGTWGRGGFDGFMEAASALLGRPANGFRRYRRVK